MFLYKLNEKEENDRESKKVTREYHNGAMDPNKDNSKYEQKRMRKKQQEEREKRRKAGGTDIDFWYFPFDV